MHRISVESAAAGAGVGKDFNEVEGPAVGQLRDLFTATETIGDENGGWASGLNGREQALVGNCLRNFKFAGFEAEWAGHSTATRLNEFDRGSGCAQQLDLAGRTAKDGLVMAVTVNQNVCTREPAGRK